MSPYKSDQYNRPETTAIIPAYNEAGRIHRVVTAACGVETLAQILVVDDGSQDATVQEVLSAGRGDPRLQVLRHTRNRGKGQALFTGWRVAFYPYLLFLDADLLHLEPDHIRRLLAPVLNGQAEMTLGQFTRGHWRTDLAQRLTPWLSGQRGLRAELMGALSEEAAAGYGFETAISILARQRRWRCQTVPLEGVSHVTGDIPRGSWRGPLMKIKMWQHVFRAWLLLNSERVEKTSPRPGKTSPAEKAEH